MSVTSIPITGPISYTVLPTGPISIRINSDNADEFLKKYVAMEKQVEELRLAKDPVKLKETIADIKECRNKMYRDIQKRDFELENASKVIKALTEELAVLRKSNQDRPDTW